MPLVDSVTQHLSNDSIVAAPRRKNSTFARANKFLLYILLVSLSSLIGDTLLVLHTVH